MNIRNVSLHARITWWTALLAITTALTSLIQGPGDASAQGTIGGGNFTLASLATMANPGSRDVGLLWNPGTAQASYQLVRSTSNASGNATIPIPNPVSMLGSLNVFVDSVPVSAGSSACYRLVPLNAAGTAIGGSDLECVIFGAAQGAVPPSARVQLNQTSNLRVSWDPAPGAAAYIAWGLGTDGVVVTSGTTVLLPGSGALICAVVLPLNSAGAIFGASNIECAIPGFSSGVGASPVTFTPIATLTGGSATPTRTLTNTRVGTETVSPTLTGTTTATPSQTLALTSTIVATSQTPTATGTPTTTVTATSTATNVVEATATITPTPAISSPTATRLGVTTETPTPTSTATRGPTSTPCFGCPTSTPSVTPTPCPSCLTPTPTQSPTVTLTGTPSATVVAGGVSWARKADMPTGRFFLAVALGPDSKIYAFGGGFQDGSVFNTVEAYDPTTNSWIGRANMPTTRLGAAAATGLNGRIYVAGGETTRSDGVALTAMEEYNPVTNTWATKAPMPTARHGLGLVAAPNGKLYAIGGYSTSAQQALGFVEEYDPTTDQWTRRADMPNARINFGAALGTDGKIYAIGGDLGGFDLQTALDIYDPTTDTWSTRGPIPTGRAEIAAATAGNGKIYVVGGFENNTELSLVEEYTPATDSWVRRTDMFDRRRGPGLAAGANGRLYAIGGFGGTGQFGTTLSSVEEGTAF